MPPHVLVIGAGFTGLALAYDLTRRGIAVTVVEQEDNVGGLAGSFDAGNLKLEKFYHHWFVSDQDVITLIRELGTEQHLVFRKSRTAVHHRGGVSRLSSPLDLLTFRPLSLLNRLRMGLLPFQAQRVRDWKRLEDLTAQEWLVRLGGEEVYHTVWEPLLLGKFGPYAREISAVWMWNKLKLRGGSRGRWGAETLAYYRGGFAALLEKMVAEIRMRGGEVHTALSVDGLISDGCQVRGVTAGGHTLEADAVVATTALPAVAQYLEPHVDLVYTAQLRRIEYLANVCLVLVLDRQLSDVYWLNVTDPGFPFVGIIEHTNLESSDTYGGRHIIYLSKYLMPSDPLFSFSGGQVLKHALPHLEQMFPGFHVSWIVDYRVWSSLYAQPVVVRHFSRLVPAPVTPLRGFFICTMAQIYPEDRGTNYAIREGRRMSRLVAAFLGKTSS